MRLVRPVLTVLLIAAFVNAAWATPTRLLQQGRLLDGSGVPLIGTHALSFALFDAATDGNSVWSEVHAADFDGGYYSVLLGTYAPLDDTLFGQGSLWLEVAVDGTTVEPRQEILAVPWALRAGSAEHLDGGVVDAAEVSVGGDLVIDASGAWVGAPPAVTWGSISGVPSDLSDGDQDSLSSLFCLDGEVAKWSGGAWSCAPDTDTDTNTQLSEIEVEGFVTNGPLALQLAPGSTLDGAAISTGTHTVDTDTNTQLTEGQVEGFVTDGPLDLDAGTTIGGASVLTSTSCLDGELLAYDSGAWYCTPIQALVDADLDGSLAWNDCDDNDPALADPAQDSDCDGTLTADDCDDNDPTSTTVSIDADCDGTITANDCDDNDPTSTTLVTDADCDGVTTTNDCDDNDPASTTLAEDADCDGSVTAVDCDDNDPSIVAGGTSGTSSECAGSACQQLLSGGYSTGSGTYWIDPDGAGPFEAYCDMGSAGGGWSLAYSNRFAPGNPTHASQFQSTSASTDTEYSTSGATISKVRRSVPMSEVMFRWGRTSEPANETTSVYALPTGAAPAAYLTAMAPSTELPYQAALSSGRIQTSTSCQLLGSLTLDRIHYKRGPAGAPHRSYLFSHYLTDGHNQIGFFCYAGGWCSNTLFEDCTPYSSDSYVEIYVR